MPAIQSLLTCVITHILNGLTVAYLRTVPLLFRTGLSRSNIMGKYLIAWILGVPLSILAIIYIVTHLF